MEDCIINNVVWPTTGCGHFYPKRTRTADYLHWLYVVQRLMHLRSICRFYQPQFICCFIILYDLLQHEKAEFLFVLLYILPQNLVWSNSDAPKTANGKFLGTTHSSATNFIFFERLAKIKYKTHSLHWVTYNTIQANKLYLGNKNYWPQKHKTLHSLLGIRYRGTFSEYAE